MSSVKSVINDSGAQIHHIRYKYIYLYLICSRIIPHNPKNLNDLNDQWPSWHMMTDCTVKWSQRGWKYVNQNIDWHPEPLKTRRLESLIYSPEVPPTPLSWGEIGCKATKSDNDVHSLLFRSCHSQTLWHRHWYCMLRLYSEEVNWWTDTSVSSHRSLSDRFCCR